MYSHAQAKAMLRLALRYPRARCFGSAYSLEAAARNHTGVLSAPLQRTRCALHHIAIACRISTAIAQAVHCWSADADEGPNSGDEEAQHYAHQWRMPAPPPLAPGTQRSAWGIDGDPMARACCNAMLRAYAEAEQWQRGLVVLTTMVEYAPLRALACAECGLAQCSSHCSGCSSALKRSQHRPLPCNPFEMIVPAEMSQRRRHADEQASARAVCASAAHHLRGAAGRQRERLRTRAACASIT